MSEGEVCPRWPEVEAAEDGRFSAREVDRVERHLAQCADCRARRERWISLREEARGYAKAPVSDLQRHRARAALLLAAAHGEEQPRRSVTPFAFAGALSFAGAVAIAAVILARRGEHRTTGTPTDPTARIEIVGEAHWTRSIEPDRETVRLTEGALQVSVPHQRVGHRFVVALPDGELEVRGTRFVVEAHGGHTVRVTVYEGLVALRVSHEPERLIAAGQRWKVPDDRPVVAAQTPPAAEVPAAVVASATPPPAQHGAHTHGSAHSESADAEAPFQRFASGVAAMGRGDFRTAAADFEDFERQQPHDERADDAGWLRVVALRRAGDEPAALTSAERYLRGYPSGAHRGEVATLLARAAKLRGDCARVIALSTSEGERAGATELRRLRDLCERDGAAP